MAGNAPAQTHTTQSHAGRASSWLAVTIMILGFTLSGVALTIGPNWVLVWTGAGLVAVGGVLALVFDIFSDVIEDAPRVVAIEEHRSPFEHHAGTA